MKSGFDISRIEGDGYLILPLSMSRLGVGQTPEVCYEMLHHFARKLSSYSNDVVFLYTNGLYMNSEEISYELRQKLNKQVLQHSVELRAIIEKRKEFIPGAFHFLPIDYVILNSPYYQEFIAILKKREKEDEQFRAALQSDTMGRDYTEANVNFLIEEIVVEHIVRQRLVELPRTLVRNDIWRLIAYPGSYIHGSAYQWKNKILPQSDKINPYGNSVYDYEKKSLFVLDEVE